MAYTRRQELMCTEAQMIAKPNVVLRENEVIYIKMNDGTLRQKIGDGVTTIINLPFTNMYDASGALAKVEQSLKKAEDAAALAVLYNGKSAYAYAKEGGYEGTEKEFATDINPDNIKAEVTPKLGVDYFTEKDKNEIIQAVIDYFRGVPIVGIVDDAKHITLNGTLPIGAYTLNYEGDNGEYSDIVNLEITEGDKETYTNVLPLAQEYASNSPYIGTDGSIGYANNMRISGSSPTTTYMKTQTGVDVVALIPVKRGDVLRFKNCNVKVTPSNTSYGTHLLGFDSTKTAITSFSCLSNNIQNRLPCVVEGDEIVQITLEPKEGWTTSEIDRVAYIMLATDGLDETSIITINQEIV